MPLLVSTGWIPDLGGAAAWLPDLRDLTTEAGGGTMSLSPGKGRSLGPNHTCYLHSPPLRPAAAPSSSCS